MVSKVLHEAGVFMGAHRDHNEESFPFLSVNQQMMDRAGNSWIEPDAHEVDYHTDETALSMYVNHFQIDPKDFELGGKPRRQIMIWFHNKPWGFKDPRSTFTLQAWLKLFPKAKIVHVVRHPKSVVDSLQRRNNVDGEVYDERLNDPDFNLELWKKYVQKGVDQMKTVPRSRRMLIRYEEMLEGGKTLTDLGRFVGADLVKGFSSRVHPDKARDAADIDLASVNALMKEIGYK